MNLENAPIDALPVARSPRGKLRGTQRFIRDVLVIVLVAFVVSVGVRAFLVRSFYVPSPSMNATLLVNDRIIVNELVPAVIPLERGDVIVFTDPGGWLPAAPSDHASIGSATSSALSAFNLFAPDGNNHLVKRVIGLPGDTVTCCNPRGQMTVNGKALNEKPYVLLPSGAPASAVPFSVVVPAKSLWVMGDNRNNSEDSRFHTGLPGRGFVPYSDVIGRAVLISWPADRWGWLDNYPQTFDERAGPR